jgi:hypothetical protein
MASRVDGQQTRLSPATREPAYRPPSRPLRRSSSYSIAAYPTRPRSSVVAGGLLVHRDHTHDLRLGHAQVGTDRQGGVPLAFRE